jgi:hypothetical protein
MLLKISKSKHPFWIILIPIAAFFLWFKSITGDIQHVYDSTNHAMPLFKLVLQMFSGNPKLSHFIALVLSLLCAFLLNRLNTKFIFIPERTYLPAIIYIVLVSSSISIQVLNPAVFAALFIIFALERIIDSYKIEQLSYNIFDASLLIGVASLFYFNAIFFIVFIWAGLILIRPFHIREWIYTILGTVLPYFILFSVYFIADIDYKTVLQSVNYSFLNPVHVTLKLTNTIFYGYVVFLILLASLFILSVFGDVFVVLAYIFFYIFCLIRANLHSSPACINAFGAIF